MKYVLLFSGNAEDHARWEAMPKDEAAALYETIGQWFTTNSGRMVDALELQPASTATTIRWDSDHKPMISDGPFAEGGEVVGGYAVINANDLDDALAVAKTWPGGPVEVRPAVER